METSEDEKLDAWLQSNEEPHNTLHTQKSETGYQPYGADKGVGSVAETRSFGPVVKARSRSSGSGGSSRCSGSDPVVSGSVALTAPAGSSNRSYQDLEKQVQIMQARLQEHGIPIPEVMQAESPPSSSGLPRPMFREAEAKIIQKGREVAEKAVEVQKLEHQVKLQQEAAAQSWERTQQREEASQRMFEQGRQAQREVEQTKAAVAAEVHAIQSHRASETARISQSQQTVEAERKRTLEIQAAIEREAAAKQHEILAKEAKIAEASFAVAQAAAAGEHRVSQLVSEFEA